MFPTQSAKDVPSAIDDLNAKKAETAGLLKLLQAYKDLGDSKSEVIGSHRFSSAIGSSLGSINHDARNFTALPEVPQPKDI